MKPIAERIADNRVVEVVAAPRWAEPVREKFSTMRDSHLSPMLTEL
jgi:hypothetical protein